MTKAVAKQTQEVIDLNNIIDRFVVLHSKIQVYLTEYEQLKKYLTAIASELPPKDAPLLLHSNRHVLKFSKPVVSGSVKDIRALIEAAGDDLPLFVNPKVPAVRKRFPGLVEDKVGNRRFQEVVK